MAEFILSFLTLCLFPSDFRSSALVYRDTFSHPPRKPNWPSLSLHNTYLSRTSLDLKSYNCQAWFIPETGGLCFFSPLYLLRKETITFYKCIILLSSPVPDPQVLCDLINWVLTLHEAKIVPVLRRKLEISRVSSYCPMEKCIAKR